jgi:transposase-like protein
MKKYSIGLKRRVVKKYLSGESSQRQLCYEYEISDKSLIREWVKKYNSGELEECKLGRRRSRFKSQEEQMKNILLENEYLKKKLLLQGESKTFIANLWSSKNPVVIYRLKRKC